MGRHENFKQRFQCKELAKNWDAIFYEPPMKQWRHILFMQFQCPLSSQICLPWDTNHNCGTHKLMVGISFLSLVSNLEFNPCTCQFRCYHCVLVGIVFLIVHFSMV